MNRCLVVKRGIKSRAIRPNMRFFDNHTVQKTCIITALLIFAPYLPLSSQESSPAVELVPDKAHVLITLKFSDLLRERKLMETLEMTEMVTQLAEGFRELGLNPDDVSNVVMFCDMSAAYLLDASNSSLFGASSAQGYSGALIYTNYNVNIILTSLNDNNRRLSYYNGYHIWCEPQSDECFAFIDEEAVMVGSSESIKDVIDVKAGQKNSFFNGTHSVDLSRMVRHINLKDVVNLSMVYPEDIQAMGIAAMEGMKIAANLMGVGILGDLFDMVGTVRGLSVSLSGKAGMLNLSSAFLMKDATAASLIAGSLILAKELAVPFVESQSDLDPDIKISLQTVKNMSVHADDNILVLEGLFDMKTFKNRK